MLIRFSLGDTSTVTITSNRLAAKKMRRTRLRSLHLLVALHRVLQRCSSDGHAVINYRRVRAGVSFGAFLLPWDGLSPYPIRARHDRTKYRAKKLETFSSLLDGLVAAGGDVVRARTVSAHFGSQYFSITSQSHQCWRYDVPLAAGGRFLHCWMVWRWAGGYVVHPGRFRPTLVCNASESPHNASESRPSRINVGAAMFPLLLRDVFCIVCRSK